jgi:hypothetical protein
MYMTSPLQTQLKADKITVLGKKELFAEELAKREAGAMTATTEGEARGSDESLLGPIAGPGLRRVKRKHLFRIFER